MRIFIDENLPPKLAQVFNTLGLVFQGKEIYTSNTENENLLGVDDVDVFPELKKRNFNIFITGDKKIPKKPKRRTAFRNSGLTGFFLNKAWQKDTQKRIIMYSGLVALLPVLIEKYESQAQSVLYQVNYVSFFDRKNLIKKI